MPTVCGKSIDTVPAAIEQELPDAVLCIGQAGGRYDLMPERGAINLDDARIKDNEGNQPIDQPVFEDGAPAYFATLPIKAMVKAMQEAGIPASVSNSAGTFVCNHVTYGVRYLIEKEFPGKRSGFIHIPYLPSQAASKKAMPSMELDTIVRGLTAAIEAMIEHQEDVKITGGTIC